MYTESLQTLFDEFFDDINYVNKKSLANKPIYDLIENDKSYIMEIPLTGIDKNDVNINVENNNLIIRADRKKNKNLKYIVQNTFFGEIVIERKFPNNVDFDNIKANMKNGMLSIEIPKQRVSKTKSIEIQ